MTVTAAGPRSRMTMRALLESSSSSTDQYNQPGPKTWATKQTDLPCWAWSTARDEVVDEDKIAVVESMEMIVPLGTSIDERDRVNGIKDRAGVVIFSGIFNVESVVRRPGDLEVTMSQGESQQT